MIVEAQEQDLTWLPNKSVERLWDFVKECSHQNCSGVWSVCGNLVLTLLRHLQRGENSLVMR